MGVKETSEWDLSIKTLPFVIDVFENEIYPGCKSIDDITKMKEYLDKHQKIDLNFRRTNQTLLTVQAKVKTRKTFDKNIKFNIRNGHGNDPDLYLPVRKIIGVEKKLVLCDFFQCTAQLYFLGCLDEDITKFIRWYLFDTRLMFDLLSDNILTTDDLHTSAETIDNQIRISSYLTIPIYHLKPALIKQGWAKTSSEKEEMLTFPDN